MSQLPRVIAVVLGSATGFLVWMAWTARLLPTIAAAPWILVV
jgi:hypothetical protein